MEALLTPANSPADCRKGKSLYVEEGGSYQSLWLDTEDPSFLIKASKAYLTNPTEYAMIFLINHPQPFPPSPDLRASSGLLRWSSSSPQDALCWLRAAVWLSHMCFWGPCPALCGCGCACSARHSVHRHNVQGVRRGCGSWAESSESSTHRRDRNWRVIRTTLLSELEE